MSTSLSFSEWTLIATAALCAYRAWDFVTATTILGTATNLSSMLAYGFTSAGISTALFRVLYERDSWLHFFTGTSFWVPLAWIVGAHVVGLVLASRTTR